MEPNHRGSLVFSEWGTAWPSASALQDPADYFELYNNSDSTVYLDGKLWGLGFEWQYDFSAWPCAQTEPVRNDPDGIWTRFVLRFRPPVLACWLAVVVLGVLVSRSISVPLRRLTTAAAGVASSAGVMESAGPAGQPVTGSASKDAACWFFFPDGLVPGLTSRLPGFGAGLIAGL